MQPQIGDEIPGGDTGGPASAPLEYAGRERCLRRVSPVWRVLWTGVGILVVLQVVGALVAPMFAQAWDARVDSSISSTLLPGQFLSAEFVINGQGIGRGSAMRMQHGLITFRGQSTPGSLAFDLDHDTCQFDAYTGEKSGPLPLGRDAVLTYVQRAGYAKGDAQARAVADQLWREIMRMRSRPLAPQRPGPAVQSGVFEYAPTQRRFMAIDIGLKGSAVYGLPWYTPWVLVVWVVMWVWMGRRIVRINGRREAVA